MFRQVCCRLTVLTIAALNCLVCVGQGSSQPAEPAAPAEVGQPPEAVQEPKSITLVRDGKTQSVIVLSTDPDANELLAGKELALYLGKISGAKVPVIFADQLPELDGRTAILVGSVAPKVIADLNLDRARDEIQDGFGLNDGFVLRAADSKLAIAGVRATGTLYGVYAFLDRLGCRWFWPGRIGEVVPANKTIEIEPFESLQRPSFQLRDFWVTGERGGDGQGSAGDQNLLVRRQILRWKRRNLISIDYVWALEHSIKVDLRDPQSAEGIAQRAIGYFTKNPESRWFSLAWKDNYISTDEELSLGLRHQWGKRFQASDAMIKFYNAVIEKVEEKFPDRLYGFNTYMNYIQAPISVKPHASLVPSVCDIEACARHYAGSGQCWQRDAVIRIVQNWCKLSNKVVYFDFDPRFLISGHVPMPGVTRIKHEVPIMYAAGVRGYCSQNRLSSMNTGANWYIRARLSWNARADVDALMDEYYKLMFGPASAEVRAYWQALEEMMHNGPGHQHEDELVKVFYPIEKIQSLEKHIKAAEEKARDATLALGRRVQVIRYSFDNLMLYLQMRQAQDQGRFFQAATLCQQMLDLHQEIEKFDPTVYKVGDLDRSHEDYAIMPGGWLKYNRDRQERINGQQGELVAMLPETWKFRIDPENLGTIYQWYAPDFQTDDWRDIKVTRIWEVQGLEDATGQGYDGLGWYRSEVEIPPKFRDRQIKINFGGVYGRMQIWVNGKFVAARPFKLPWWKNAYNRSFDYDLSEVIKPGLKNTITIRVENEFEWGGIYRRLFLWSPNPAEN